MPPKRSASSLGNGEINLDENEAYRSAAANVPPSEVFVNDKLEMFLQVKQKFGKQLIKSHVLK